MLLFPYNKWLTMPVAYDIMVVSSEKWKGSLYYA